jgi:hypothetical protein
MMTECRFSLVSGRRAEIIVLAPGPIIPPPLFGSTLFFGTANYFPLVMCESPRNKIGPNFSFDNSVTECPGTKSMNSYLFLF